MRALKMIIVPTESETRLLARNAESSKIWLRATLPTEANNPRAVPNLLTSLAGFLPIRAALVVPARTPSCVTRLYPDWFHDVGGDGYDLQVIGGTRRERREWWGR